MKLAVVLLACATIVVLQLVREARRGRRRHRTATIRRKLAQARALADQGFDVVEADTIASTPGHPVLRDTAWNALLADLVEGRALEPRQPA